MPDGGRVLVVDDEENVRETTAAILGQEGYRVETASDGREALRKIGRDGGFDLVLTDLHTEDAGGDALLGELCAKHPDVAVVVLTGYASLESSIDAMRCGVYDYLIKPCVIDDLKATVRRALDHGRRRLVSEMSSPVVEIWDGILLLPVVGTLDDARAAEMSAAMLEKARATDAVAIIIDVTGCTVVDTHVAAHLINTVHSARLLGARAIITGIGAGVAANLITLGVDLEGIRTRRRLADGLRTAFEYVGVSVRPRNARNHSAGDAPRRVTPSRSGR